MTHSAYYFLWGGARARAVFLLVCCSGLSPLVGKVPLCQYSLPTPPAVDLGPGTGEGEPGSRPYVACPGTTRCPDGDDG